MKTQTYVGDAVMGLILCGLGLWWLKMSWGLGLGNVHEPGPGFFPAMISGALVLGGLGCAFRAWYARADGEPRPWMERSAVKAAALIVLLCVFFAVGGFVPCAVLFLFAMMRFVGQVKVVKAAAMAVIVTLVMWLLFERLLSVQLPTGFLS